MPFGWLEDNMLQLDQAILNDGKRRSVLRDFGRANHQRFMWMFIVIVAIGAFPSLAALPPLVIGSRMDQGMVWSDFRRGATITNGQPQSAVKYPE